MSENTEAQDARGFLAEHRFWRKLIVVLSLLALGLQIVLVARGWTFYQYDFRAYYSGPYLFSIG